MTRTFIAIKIDFNQEILNLLDQLKITFKSDSINWTDINRAHLTLFFLGNTSIDQIDDISNELQKISSKNQYFNLKISELCFFHQRGQPKVIWLGIENNEKLIGIQNDIQICMRKYGFNNIPKRFTPHLTLGRIKKLKNKELLQNYVKKYERYCFDEVQIKSFVFYESILTPKGAVYKTIKSFNLCRL